MADDMAIESFCRFGDPASSEKRIRPLSELFLELARRLPALLFFGILRASD